MRYTYIPAIGEQVKLKTYSDYTNWGLPMWAWLRVCGNPIHDPATVTLEIMNGKEHTHTYRDIPLAAIEPPIGWSERYTIHVSPDKVQEVLSWLTRGIAVRACADLGRAGDMAYQPADNADTPHWAFPSVADVVPPEQTIDRIRIVKLESIPDAFVMRPCRYCTNGKRTRENSCAALTSNTTTCPKCHEVMGFSFDAPYHEMVSKAYPYNTPETDPAAIVQCPPLRQAGECWVCNGTGMAAKYISETDTKRPKRGVPSERETALAELRGMGYKVWYQKKGYQSWWMERKTGVKDFGRDPEVAV